MPPRSGSARCGCRGTVIDGRQATNRALISSRIGEKPKVLKRYFWGSTSETTAGRVTTDGQPPMRSAGFMPKSRLVKVAKSKSVEALFLGIDVRDDCWPGDDGWPAADAIRRPHAEIASGKSRQVSMHYLRGTAAKPESDLVKVAKCQSTTIGDRWSLPGRRDRQPAEATCHPRSASIGDPRSGGSQQAQPGRSSARPAADHIAPDDFDASAAALLSLIEVRADPARSCKPSASVIGASAEIGVGAMPVAWKPSSGGGRRRTEPRSQVASGKSQKC